MTIPTCSRCNVNFVFEMWFSDDDMYYADFCKACLDDILDIWVEDEYSFAEWMDAHTPEF